MKAQRTITLPLIAATITAVIWGFSFVFTKGALNHTFPDQLLGLRFATGAITITLLKIFDLIRIELLGKKWTTLLPLALLQPGLYFMGETWGVKWTTASEAGMIIALVPIVTVAMAAFILKERIHPVQILAILTSIAGVFIIVSTRGKIEFGQHLWGIASLFLAVIGASGYNILSKKSSANFTPVEITFVMMWVGTILFNTLGLIQSFQEGTTHEYLYPLTLPGVVISVLFLGILASVVGFFLFNYAISYLKVSQSAPLLNLTTVVSVIAGVLVQNDPFSWRHLIGIILIILGVWATNIFAQGSKGIQGIESKNIKL